MSGPVSGRARRRLTLGCGVAVALIALVLLSPVMLVGGYLVKVHVWETFWHFQAINHSLDPVFDAIYEGEDLDPATVRQLAEDPRVRASLVELLVEEGWEDRVPSAYRLPLPCAESELYTWLHYPAELDAWPNQMEPYAQVTVLGQPGGPQLVHAFRFRVDSPHWAAEDGWMLGIAGPFVEGIEPCAPTDHRLTFSELQPVSPETLEALVKQRYLAINDWALRSEDLATELSSGE